MDMLTSVENQSLDQKITHLLQKQPIILQVLRFGAIGVLNTALDFLIFNFVSKTLNITSGFQLGGTNIPGFVLAIIQSYFWNRYWTFSEANVNLWKNFIRLILVGALGAVSFLMALVGAKLMAPPGFYLIILALFVVLEVVLWHYFAFDKPLSPASSNAQFVTFFVVSVIGLGINLGLVSVISQNFKLSLNGDLNKNLAKIAATFASLIWNFIGYKVVVFKK